MMNTRKLYTPGEVARKLGLTTDQVLAHIRDGMPVQKEGNKVRVDQSDAQSWLAQRQELKLSFDLAMQGIDRLMIEDT